VGVLQSAARTHCPRRGKNTRSVSATQQTVVASGRALGWSEGYGVSALGLVQGCLAYHGTRSVHTRSFSHKQKDPRKMQSDTRLSTKVPFKGSLCFSWRSPQRALPTETIVESGTSRSKSGTSVNYAIVIAIARDRLIMRLRPS